MRTITLYHGTDSLSAQDIIDNGFAARSCLTTCVQLADYYCEARMEELQDKGKLNEDIEQVILQVVLSVDALVVDYPAYEEPISIYRNKLFGNDEDWHEGCENGDVPYPENEFDVEPALEATTCVRVKKRVSADIFTVYE